MKIKNSKLNYFSLLINVNFWGFSAAPTAPIAEIFRKSLRDIDLPIEFLLCKKLFS